MIYEDLLKIYRSTPYEPLIPETNPEASVVKFNSVIHYINWVEAVDSKFGRASNKHSSENAGTSDFNLLSSLPEAFDVIPKLVFENDNTRENTQHIRNTRKSTVFRDNGHELEIPEFLAGATKHWIDETSRRSKTRLVDTPIFIQGAYTSFRNAEDMKNAGISLVSDIYKTGIIPKKIVFCLMSEGARYNDSNTCNTMIDITFNDLNSLVKAIHPEFFRRINFRHIECYPDLTDGYGCTPDFPTGYGMISLTNYWDSSDKKTEVSKLLGLTK